MSLLAPSAKAFRDSSFSAGVGYYSQNALGKTTTSTTSAPSTMGASSYPLNLKYDWRFGFDWYLSPQLSYSVVPRNSAGESAKTTMLHLLFPLGMNFSDWGTSHWDWSMGPGIIQYTIKGAGGLTTLSNGTGTAVFAVPGDSSTIKNITFNAGTAYNFSEHRLGLDIIIEGLLSAGKRTESFMLSYAYRFGGYGR